MRFKLQRRERARQLRRDPTVAERAAWALLRNRRILGYKFRRQYPLHGFYLDFYCPELKLALEVDGPIHQTKEQLAYDTHRAAALEPLGVRIVRVANDSVSVSTFEELTRKHLARDARQRGSLPRHRDVRPPSPHCGEGDRG